MTYSFVCPECHSYFITRRHDQKFCSHSCASKNRKVRRERVFLTDPSFFNSHVPREEIERLMELKQVERTPLGT